jgi:hypothetical protein
MTEEDAKAVEKLRIELVQETAHLDGECKAHDISKKYFRQGAMAPSEWTRSVRAVRDTPVADYSAPGVNSTRRFPYRPLISVSPFLLVLSISYFK